MSAVNLDDLPDLSNGKILHNILHSLPKIIQVSGTVPWAKGRRYCTLVEVDPRQVLVQIYKAALGQAKREFDHAKAAIGRLEEARADIAVIEALDDQAMDSETKRRLISAVMERISDTWSQKGAHGM